MAYPATRIQGDNPMDYAVPCNPCTSIYRKPTLNRQTTCPKSFARRSNVTKWRIKTMSELQTPVGVTDRAGSYSPSIPTHKVTVHDRQRGVVHQFLVPEDQYILHTAESQDITLPFACRHGCCTSCAVRVKSGQLRQPEALGISAELKSKGYALLCVGYPSSDLEVETQDEDEVYWLQFGRYFARGPIERDDYALELAMGDE
ncbi:LOW QUALITY PROTEIN: ferredoxin C 2, chloroplastic [Prunus dulcis]|nr:LOW QUALITY PROTEIN: ferredoxin C 2, chloroplastic [Prunus dulcis]